MNKNTRMHRAMMKAVENEGYYLVDDPEEALRRLRYHPGNPRNQRRRLARRLLATTVLVIVGVVVALAVLSDA